MKLSTTLVVLTLFAVALGAYLKMHPPVEEVARLDLPPLVVNSELLDLGADDKIKWLQIQNLAKKEVLTLVFQENLWMLKYPVQDRANQQIVGAFIKKLSALEKQKSYLPEKSWEEYGLLLPNYKIGIETTAETNRKYLYLGDASPVDAMIFARWEDEPGYFLLDPEIKKIFGTSLYTLRDKTVFRISTQEPSKVLFRTGAESYKVVRQADGWFWLYPGGLRKKVFNQEDAAKLMQQLGNLYVKDFLDGDEAKKVSFDNLPSKPYVKLWGLPEEMSAVHIGVEFPARDAHYAKREGEQAVLLIDRDRIRILFEIMTTLAREAEEY